jgi:hypothetical protein
MNFISSHLRLDLPNSIFPSGFPTKTLYVFVVARCGQPRCVGFDNRNGEYYRQTQLY